MQESSAFGGGTIPILLLKTKSTPNDGYEEFFGTVKEGQSSFAPTFVPVLEHKFLEKGLNIVRGLLKRREIGKEEGMKYGGLIFTSQRAVEAFAKLVEEERGQFSMLLSSRLGLTCLLEAKDSEKSWPHLQGVPIYTVGPATSRALKAISQESPLSVFGSDTGNGEALAHYMLQHYSDIYRERRTKPALLFLVGDTRRDIIPKTLMSPALPEEQRIQVDELVVYDTGVMDSFEHDFATLLQVTQDSPVRWVVVFSPTGCQAMLRALGMIDDETGKVKTGERGGGCGNRKGKRKTYIATIGPTTRDFLRKSFGFEPDVCAEKPSPEGVGEGIKKFMDAVAQA